jgi:RNA-directed DNA polymerase
MIKPTITTQELQRRIGHRAKSAPEHRFWGMHVHLEKLSTLETAYLEAKRNGGAPGSDGETFEAIEVRGRREFLTELSAELRSDVYRPRPYRRREIPKEGGKVRVISIPTIRDRVVQGALRLLLEPIFEADFSRHSFGARPGRSAHDAIGEVRAGLMWHKLLVLDVDLKSYFDDIRHGPVLAKVARRVSDARVPGAASCRTRKSDRAGMGELLPSRLGIWAGSYDAHVLWPQRRQSTPCRRCSVVGGSNAGSSVYW